MSFIFWVFFFAYIVILLKLFNTYENHEIIANAIHDYNVQRIKDGECLYVIDYEDMRNFDECYYRFWDWSYKNILPKDEYEMVKKYIKE